jgi:hypothetical protein
VELNSLKEVEAHFDIFGNDAGRQLIYKHVQGICDPTYLHKLADLLLSKSMFDLASFVYNEKNKLLQTSWGFLNYAICIFKIGPFDDALAAFHKALSLSSAAQINLIFSTGCQAMFGSVDTWHAYQASVKFVRAAIRDFSIESALYIDLGLQLALDRLKNRFSTIRQRLQYRLDVWYTACDPRFKNIANLSNKIKAVEYVKMLGIPTPKVFFLDRDLRNLNPACLPESFVVKPDNGADSKGVMVIFRGINLFDGKQVDKYSSGFWDYASQHVLGAAHTNSQTRILIEEFMEDDILPGSIPLDYKVHCYGGKARFIQVINRNPGFKGQSFYDRDWGRLSHVIDDYPENSSLIKPPSFDLLMNYADTIADSISCMLRIDFYLANRSVYFGEITTYPAGGYNFTKYGNQLSIQLWEIFPDAINIYGPDDLV